MTEDGLLVPWAARQAGAWKPGVNTAVCLTKPGVRRHVAPMPECGCGLYALTSVWDGRLNPHVLAAGAIVAWGDIEVHYTGFRAGSAAIVALGLPDRCDVEHQDRLRRAAERYGVPLVPFAGLPATAGEHGRRLEPYDTAQPIPEDDRDQPRLWETGSGGIAVHSHLEVELLDSRLRLRPTDLLAADILRRPTALHPVGTHVQRGDPVLEALGRRGALTIPSPISGRLTWVRGGGDSADDVNGGWVAEIAPSAWADEVREIAWGDQARPLYAAELACAVNRSDPLIQLRTHWLSVHADVRSAGAVFAALRAARGAPRFSSEADVNKAIGQGLRTALEDPQVARHVTRMPIRVLWRLHEPDADLMLDLTGATPTVVTGPPDRDADLVLFASAVTADEVFLGRTDMPAALRRREIQTSAPLSAVLHAESVLKRMKPVYRALRAKERAEQA